MIAAIALFFASGPLHLEAAWGRSRGLPAPPMIMVYHDSWRERPVATALSTLLANTPPYANIVVLAFAKPDLAYHGDLDLSGTGLNYPFSGNVLHDAIELLKRRNPKTRILVSVGGGNAPGWEHFDARALALLVRTLDADGVDIDFEPTHPGCRNVAGRIGCDIDGTWIALVRQVRAVLPRPYVVSVTGWSVGAYGEGRFAKAGPASPWTGVMLGLLRSHAAKLIDVVTLCSYDAGPTYDPMLAFAAYRKAWRGPLLLGFEVPFKDAGGPFFSPAEVEVLARRLVPKRGDGIMVYSFLEPPDASTRAFSHPTGRQLARAACRGLRGASNPICNRI